MPKASNDENAQQPEAEPELSKEQLQRQMELTRQSLAETVGEIKQTVDQEVRAVRKSVSGVLDYRAEFQKEPLVWSLGALSAGFALGYTVGYAHKNTKRGKQPPVIAFADSMVADLSTVGEGLVLPALNAKIKELFGFEFSELLEQMKGAGKPRTKKKPRKRMASKTMGKRIGGKKVKSHSATGSSKKS